MKTVFTLLFAVAGASAIVGNANASCMASGASSQSVSLSAGGKNIERWEVKPTEIHRTRLANGFELGLKIEPATAEKYAELFERTKLKAFDELVKISLYDMSGAEPKMLTPYMGRRKFQAGLRPSWWCGWRAGHR